MGRHGTYDPVYGFLPEDDFPEEQKPQTNADRIRAMSDEELSEKMSGLESFALTCGRGWPPEKWLDWLKRPVWPGEDKAEDGE